VQLVFVGVDVDRAPAGRAHAALPQWAVLEAPPEAGLPGRGDMGLVAGRAGDRAGLLVDGEVVLVEPGRHRRGKRRRPDRLRPCSPVGEAGSPAAGRRAGLDPVRKVLTELAP
jgi:hypothetical protein